MFRSGRAVAAAAEAADHGADAPRSDDAVQPNGVEATVECVIEQWSPGHVGRDDRVLRDRTRGDRRRQLVGKTNPVNPSLDDA